MAFVALEDIEVEVCRKRIKNMYLRVTPPQGRVLLSVPYGMDTGRIREFAAEHLSWIRKQKEKIESLPQLMPKKYMTGEYFYLWGRKYELAVYYAQEKNIVVREGQKLCLRLRCNREASTIEQRQKILLNWYRAELSEALPAMIAVCENIVGQSAKEYRLKYMRTKWGTCNIVRRRIWLNLQLAEHEKSCLQYVLIHELVHLLERRHNRQFKIYMDLFCPNWRDMKSALNRIYE